MQIKTPRWALPLLNPSRYKFISGGRGSGKSHERAEAVVEAMAMEPDCRVVCIREIQKSLKFSAYSLIVSKIHSLGVSHLFDILTTEIRRKNASGICIFQGMQDHTADSIKSLEGFKIAWVEEAQSLSHKSLKMLRPTIRSEGSELWFTWNPDQEDDAVDKFAKQMRGNPDAIHVHVNYDSNPWLPKELYDEMDWDRKNNPDDYDHIWLGDYDSKSEARVFRNWSVEDFEATGNEHFYYGCDWGFSQDPAVLLRTWINEAERKIYVDYQIDRIGLEIDHTPAFFDEIPQSRQYKIRADSARPEMNSYMNRQGFIVSGVEKGKDTVEMGVKWLKSYQLIINPRCKLLEKELRLYSYEINKAGDILPKLEDKNNHCIDALRYAYEPLYKAKTSILDVI